MGASPGRVKIMHESAVLIRHCPSGLPARRQGKPDVTKPRAAYCAHASTKKQLKIFFFLGIFCAACPACQRLPRKLLLCGGSCNWKIVPVGHEEVYLVNGWMQKRSIFLLQVKCQDEQLRQRRQNQGKT